MEQLQEPSPRRRACTAHRNVPARAAPLVAALVAACAAPSDTAAVRADLSTPEQLGGFEFTDPAAWRHAEVDGRGCLELFARSDYEPPFRSPLSIALVHELEFGDLEMSVRAQSTKAEYPHRDLILVFGWRDPAHYCYAHLASVGDQNAHQVFVVDGAPRRPVTTARTAGVQWTDGWHKLRLVRRGPRVEVFFDDRETPELVGEVPEWRGRIGVGSFDDTGRFRWLQARSL